MAYIKSAAIVTRLREVLQNSAGALRTVPADRFLGDLPDGLDVGEAMRRALEAPRIAVRVSTMGRDSASPPLIGDVQLEKLGVEVRVIRTVTTLEQISETDADALEAAALTDGDVIRQAMSYPGNLATTTAGTATDIVSGLLVYQGSRFDPSGAINDGAQRFESVHTFTGIAISRPAVT